MLKSTLTQDQYVEIFPHVEKILHTGVYSVDIIAQTSSWSEGVYAMLGLTQHDIPSDRDTFYSYIDEADRPRVLAEIHKSIETGIPYQIEFQLTDVNGKRKWIYAENFPLKDSAGKVISYTGVIKDITERYLINYKLRQKIDELNKLNAQLEEFVYIASHDLQEPIRKVITFTDRFCMNFAQSLPPEGTVYLDKILSSARNMQQLIEDLLNLSRLSNIANTELQEIATESCVTEAMNDLELMIQETGTVITCTDLPVLRVHKQHIKQLFYNLLYNSIKFRKPSKTAKIDISARTISRSECNQLELQSDYPFAEITIKDNGIGFEQKYADKIFNMFQRLNGKSEYQGSGIGLAICKKIVEMHGGKISAAGIPDEGAVFAIYLPMQYG